MANKLFTAAIDRQLANQYKYGSDLSKQKVVTKIFNPYGEGRWYLLNSDPNDPDYIWAIVSMFGEVEIGSVSRRELESIRLTPYRLPLERDRYFDPINAEEVYQGLLGGKFYAKGGGFDQYGNAYGFDRDYDSVYEIHHKPEMNSEKPYLIWDKIDGEYVGAYPNRQRAIEWIERQSVYAKGGKVTKKNKGDEFEIGNYVILFGFYDDGEYITSKTKPIYAKSREELDEKILKFIDQFHSYEGIEPEIIGEQKIMADGGGFEKKKSYSIEDVEWAENYLEETNNKPNVDAKYATFIIDISGKYQVYYTFWRMLNKVTSPYVKNPVYLGNLSTDLRKAVKTARERLPNSYIILDRTGTKTRLADPLMVKFGKYRGAMLEDVFLQDPNYVLWLSNNYTGKSAEFVQKLKELKELYFKNVTEKNRENSISEYKGNIGDKLNLLLKVYRIKQSSTSLGVYEERPSYQYYFVDADGNKYYTYSIKDNDKYKPDDILEVQGTVAQHKEILGVKYTYLNRLKVLSVIDDPTKMFEDGGLLEDSFAEGGVINTIPAGQEYRYVGSNSIEKDIIGRIEGQLSGLKFAGNFDIKDWKRFTSGYLYFLDEFDKDFVKNVPLKKNEMIFRYYTRVTAIGGMIPLVKINLESGLMYFNEATDFGDESIRFSRKGERPMYLNLVEGVI